MMSELNMLIIFQVDSWVDSAFVGHDAVIIPAYVILPKNINTTAVSRHLQITTST